MLVAKAELNYYPEEIYQEKIYQEKTKENEKNKKQDRRKVRENQRLKVLFKLFCLFVAVTYLSISLFVLFRYAKITKMRMEVNELERKKIELEKHKQDTLADLESIKSSLNISEDAIYKLGMSYPKEGQIMYVAIGNDTENTIQETVFSEKFNKVLVKLSDLF